MEQHHKGRLYTTREAHENQGGCSALELHSSHDGSSKLVARVVFWDAEGQFALEMKGPELPMSIVEELIAEAKAKIKVG